MLARLHDESAERQDEAADKAEATRRADAAVEGDQWSGRVGVLLRCAKGEERAFYGGQVLHAREPRDDGLVDLTV